MLDGLGNAMPQMILKQAHGHGLQRPGDRRDLGQDVDAVRVVFDHPVQAANLSLNPAEALEVGIPVLRVAAHAENGTPGGRPTAACDYSCAPARGRKEGSGPAARSVNLNRALSVP